MRDAARFGVDATVDGVRWADVRDRIFQRIDPIAEGGKRYRVEGPGTTAFLGHARFTGDRRLTVDLGDAGERTLTADQVVIAAGAHPVIPEVVARVGVPFHTSDTIMRIDELPEHLVIIGGGYIGVEMAHIFASFGVRVSVVARGTVARAPPRRRDRPPLHALAREQWDVRTGTTVDRRRRGTVTACACTSRTSGSSVLEGDLLLVATGRRPNTADLGVEAGGIPLHDDGRVVVDEVGRTSAPGVWALGDVSRPTSSSTSPTPRPGPSRTTSCTPTTSGRCRTTTCRPASSATRRWPRSG